MIEVKAYYGTWKEATLEQAIDLARHIYNHSTLPKDKALNCINENHVKGVVINERDIRAEY